MVIIAYHHENLNKMYMYIGNSYTMHYNLCNYSFKFFYTVRSIYKSNFISSLCRNKSFKTYCR